MKKPTKFVTFIFFALVFLPSSAFADGAYNVSTPLIAGRHIEAGSVNVSINKNFVSVQIETDYYSDLNEGWKMTELHLYMGAQPPKKSAPGQFPYKFESENGLKAHYQSLLLSDLEAKAGGKLYIAVHADLVYEGGIYEEEGAWAAGELFGKGCAMYFSVDIPSGDPPKPGPKPKPDPIPE